MEPPPLPHSGPFRLRVQIFAPQDAHNLYAMPMYDFIIAKTAVLPLPGLSLQALYDAIVKRFQSLYPNELPFAVEKPQNAFGSDLHDNDQVCNVFTDNDVFRVIKGSSYRASIEPYRARSSSVQPNSYVGGRKRDRPDSRNFENAQKRQRTVGIDPDHPVQSTEQDVNEPLARVSAKDGEQNTEISGIRVVAGNQRRKPSPQIQGVVQPELSARTSSQTKAMNYADGHLSSRQLSNRVSRVAASFQNPSSPVSVGSSFRDEFVTSGSDTQRATSGPKRQLIFLPTDELYRGGSASTALTTPRSVIQESDGHSLADDAKKLKRTNAGTNKANSEVQRRVKPLPRADVYDVVETDYEDAHNKSTEQKIPPKIITPVGVSVPKFYKKRSSTTPSSDHNNSIRRISASLEKQQKSTEQHKRENVEQVRLKDDRARTSRLSKQQVEPVHQRLVREDSEENRISQENYNREHQAKAHAKRAERRNRLQDEAASREEFQEDIREKENSINRDGMGTLAAAEGKGFDIALSDKRSTEGDIYGRDKMSASKNNDEIRETKRQELVQFRQENQRNLEETRSSFKKSTPHPRGMLSRTVVEYDSNIGAESSSEKQATPVIPISAHSVSINKKTSCTPLIPRGRPSGLSPSTSSHSQAIASSSPKALPPNVGLEAQMPLPPLSSMNKQRVSFQNPPLSASRRSSSANSSLIQTTLVPRRVNMTKGKVTHKNALSNSAANGLSLSSNSAKGKAKIVESPGKPPSPSIVISDDEAADSDLTEGYRYVKPYDPSQAYQKSEPQSSILHIDSELNTVDPVSAVPSTQSNIYPQASSVSTMILKNKTTTAGISPLESRSELASMHPTVSDHQAPQRSSSASVDGSFRRKTYAGSQSRSSAQAHNSFRAAVPFAPHKVSRSPVYNQNADDGESGSEYKASEDGSKQDSVEDIEDDVVSSDDSEVKVRRLSKKSKRMSNDAEQVLEDNVEKGTVDRLSDEVEKYHQVEPRAIMKISEAQPKKPLDQKNTNPTNPEEEYGSGSDSATDHSDGDDGVSTPNSESDSTQAQLDYQLTQSSPRFSRLQPRTSSLERGTTFPKQDVEAEQLRAKMPSLSRNLQEIRNTKEADQNASKARTLANAQQMKDEATQLSDSEDTSDNDTASDESINLNENAVKASDQERAKIRKELSSKIANINDTSSSPVVKSAITPQSTFPRKETRILPPPRPFLRPKEKKIGFEHLAKEFAVKRN